MCVHQVAATQLFRRSLFLIYLLLANIVWMCPVCECVCVCIREKEREREESQLASSSVTKSVRPPTLEPYPDAGVHFTVEGCPPWGPDPHPLEESPSSLPWPACPTSPASSPALAAHTPPHWSCVSPNMALSAHRPLHASFHPPRMFSPCPPCSSSERLLLTILPSRSLLLGPFITFTLCVSFSSVRHNLE